MAIAVPDAPATSPIVSASTSSGFLGRLVRLFGTAGRDASRARAAAVLHRLDDRTLKDIGVHRTEVSSILYHDLRDATRRRR